MWVNCNYCSILKKLIESYYCIIISWVLDVYNLISRGIVTPSPYSPITSLLRHTHRTSQGCRTCPCNTILINPSHHWFQTIIHACVQSATAAWVAPLDPEHRVARRSIMTGNHPVRRLHPNDVHPSSGTGLESVV